GETHQGIFDVPMLRTIPNTTIYAPATFEELRRCLTRAIYDTEGIAAVRYPKGGEMHANGAEITPARDFSYSGKRAQTLGISYGRISANLISAANEVGADYLRLVVVNPLPESVYEIALGYEKIVFFEEGSLAGGAAEGFFAELLRRGYRGKAEAVGVSGEFVPAASQEEQFEMYGLDCAHMKEKLV
ncbi:MAG TPA: 1-deoxy-D-xylulose-5-phosphate synthase, partial [Ruminococcaceae bacterium]|nr:1-deoxy-D-xylulose-5-phosphate synthase [Oscillospiraceae bacterium]